MPMWISDRRIYTTADGSRAVEEGDPDSAILLVGQGCSIPEETARKYGLIKDEEPQSEGGDSDNQKTDSDQGEDGEGKSSEGDKAPEGGQGDNQQTEGGKKPEGKAKPGNKK